MTSTRHPAYPHVVSAAPLRRICDEVYVIDSSLAVFKAMSVHTRMTVLVLPRGELLVYSPLPPDLVDRDAIAALGTVKYVIAPNSMHKSFARAFAAAYDGSRLYCSPSIYEVLRAEEAITYGEKLEYGTRNEAIFGSTVVVRVVEHYKPFREVVILHRPSRTLLIGDLAFNLTGDDVLQLCSPLFRFYLWLSDGYRCLSLSRTIRFLIKRQDAEDLVPELEGLVRNLDFDRVIPCHGSVVETGGKQVLEAGTIQFMKDIATPNPQRTLIRRAIFGAIIAGIVTIVVVLVQDRTRVQ